MSRLRNKLFALCVIAIWLVATQHCGLEAAGVLAAHDEEPSTCCASSGGCTTDGCATVEEGAYRLDGSPLAAPIPSVSSALALLDATPAPPPDAAAPASRTEFERPLDWVRTWQFARRAALFPRAPSLGTA